MIYGLVANIADIRCITKTDGSEFMAQASQALLNAKFETDSYTQLDSFAARISSATATSSDVRLFVHDDLSKIERDWRAFELHADCTVFQTYDWLATWFKHIGARNGTAPVVVVGRDADGSILFLLPLAIENGVFARRLTWLGSALCDYNGPLLAANFSKRIDLVSFATVWHNVLRRLQSHPQLRYDLVCLEKMSELVGAQPNPFFSLRVAKNPSGAYRTQLAESWNSFYAKRSAATRRRDNTKLKRLAEHGDIQFVTASEPDDIVRTLHILMEQKSRSFARMGVANMFKRPGYREFYLDLAINRSSCGLAHASRLDVGSTAAAANLGLTFGGSYYHLLASYDDGKLSRFGPGVAHLHELLRYAIEHGIQSFDFTIGDERYKRDWCDAELPLYDHVKVTTWRGALAAMSLLPALRLKRWIKQTPILWSAFAKGRTLLGSLRRSRG